MRHLIAFVPLCFVVGLMPCPAHEPDVNPPTSEQPTSEQPPGATYEGRAFQFHEIRPGVYHAVGTGELSVICNSTIIVNESDVMVVDSHVTPAAAWALQQELKLITPKPIRYVVNTHFHYDHSHGNQSFGPDVEIIGHEFTRQAMLEGMSNSGRAHGRLIEGISTNINRLTALLESAADETAKTKLEKQLRIAKSLELAAASVKPKPPTITFNERLILHPGSREIRLLYLGRGHTGGDIVVHLPKEGLVITGDLLLPAPSYMGNAYVNEWAETLERLKSLDFDTVVPGHGMAFSDLERIDHIQEYLRDLWKKVASLHAQEIPAATAAQTVSMHEHAQHFNNRIPRNGVDVHAVERIYELLDDESR